MYRYKIGEKKGDLTILAEAERSTHGDRQYLCRCECGEECVRRATVIEYNIKRGYINSCGCRKRGNVKNFKKISLTFSQL